jgi:hypothetical protein
MRCYRNDQAAATARITPKQAAGMLLLLYERLYKDLASQPVTFDNLPEEIEGLRSISVD